MITLGNYNTLRIVKRVDFGLYLSPITSTAESAGESEQPTEETEILLPARYVTPQMRIGNDIEVFIYLDQDERLVATTERPVATVGQFACLKCSWTNQYGAFLSWGLQMKDLFCPFREQKQRMERDKKYIVYIRIDEDSYRLMATAKVERYQTMTGYERALGFTEVLLQYLKDNNGRCNLGDKSPAELIEDRFKVSKKTFKRAVGDLYKRRLITISDEEIKLI